MTTKTLSIWRFTDGKPGHEKQTEALIQILQQHYVVTVTNFKINQKSPYYLWQWLTGKSIGPETTNKPHLVIGAGHRTHIPMILAAKQQNAKTVVIMKPSLPTHLFSLVIAPEHDYLKKEKPHNLITVPYALTAPINSRPDPNRGLILLGGPSKHFSWDDEHIAEQLSELIRKSSSTIHWQLTTSRRTPKTTEIRLKTTLESDRVEWLNHQNLPSDWLYSQMQTAGHIWVTADSASMIAEALSTKAKVGILDVRSLKSTNKFQYDSNDAALLASKSMQSHENIILSIGRLV